MTAIHSHLKQLRQDRGMTQETVAQRMGLTRQAVSSHESGHTRPDGDCVGSCIGLHNYIVDNYPDISVDIYLETIADSYKLVKNTEAIRQPGTEPKVYDLFICLDTSQKDRMTKGAELYFDAAKVTVNIDHHVSNTKFAGMNHVVVEASSASEVVYDLLNETS